MASFERIREALDRGDTSAAIGLACKSRHLGEHRDAITKAKQAASSPEFYRAIGLDPAQLVAEGVAAVTALCEGGRNV